MLQIFLLLFFEGLASSLAIISSQKPDDPTHGGIFTTPRPYVDPDEYHQPKDKQDEFDWKLTRVSN